MVSFKIKYIGWFFQTLWQCLKDLYGSPIKCYKESLFSENWKDFLVAIALDNDPDFSETMEMIIKEDKKYNNEK